MNYLNCLKFKNPIIQAIKASVYLSIYFFSLLVCGQSSDSEQLSKNKVNDSSTKVSFYYNKWVDDQPVAYLEKKKNYHLAWPDLYFAEREYYNDQVEVIQMGPAKKASKNYVDKKLNKRTISSDVPLDNPSVFHDDSRIKVVFYGPMVMVPIYQSKESISVDNVHYYAKLKHKDLRYLPPLYFHDEKFAKHKTIQIEIPKWLDLDIKEVNFGTYKIEKEVVEKASKTIITYTMNFLTGVKKKDFEPSWATYKPHLLLIPKSTNKKKGGLTYFRNTNDLYQWYKGLVDQMDNTWPELKPLVTELLKDCNSDEEKIDRLYYWVQDNIRYLAFEDGIAGFKPENSMTVFEDKFGDCKGMANLLTEMLKEAGFDANLSWIGTRGKKASYDYSIPSLMVDNHMISTLFYKDSTYFLDPTEKYCSFGDYAYRIQGRPVLISQGDSFKVENVPDFHVDSTKYTKDYHSDINLETGIIRGTANIALNGEKKRQFLRAYYSVKKKDRLDFLYSFFDISNRSEESNIVVKGLDDRSAQVNVQMEYSNENDLIKTEEGYYLNYDYSEIVKSISKYRSAPVALGQKLNKEEMFEIKLPTGYELVDLPESTLFENDDFSFMHSYEIDGDVFRFRSKIVVFDGEIQIPNLPEWMWVLKFAEENTKNVIKLKRI